MEQNESTSEELPQADLDAIEKAALKRQRRCARNLLLAEKQEAAKQPGYVSRAQRRRTLEAQVGKHKLLIKVEKVEALAKARRQEAKEKRHAQT